MQVYRNRRAEHYGKETTPPNIMKHFVCDIHTKNVIVFSLTTIIKGEKTKETTFSHITNLPLNQETIAQTSQSGRLRWKIENEGFNTLKNGGYGMEHKWVRKSYQGLKNYFQFMQMAYLINQLVVKRTRFQEDYLQGKNHPTLKSLWEDLIAVMKWANVKVHRLKKILKTKIQFRIVT